jgi:hypothetical protein
MGAEQGMRDHRVDYRTTVNAMAPAMRAHQAPTQFASSVKAIGIEPLPSEQAAQTAAWGRDNAHSKGVFDILHSVTVRLAAIIRPMRHPPYVSLQPTRKQTYLISRTATSYQSERIRPGLQLEADL